MSEACALKERTAATTSGRAPRRIRHLPATTAFTSVVAPPGLHLIALHLASQQNRQFLIGQVDQTEGVA